MATARLRGRDTASGTAGDRARSCWDKPRMICLARVWLPGRQQSRLRAQELQGRDPAAVTAGQEGPAPASGGPGGAPRSPWCRAPIPMVRWNSMERTLSSAHSSDAFGCFDVSSRRHHSSAEMLIIPLGSFLLFVMGFSLLYNIHFSS